MVCIVKQATPFAELHNQTSRYFLGDCRFFHSDKGFWRNDVFLMFNSSWIPRIRLLPHFQERTYCTVYVCLFSPHRSQRWAFSIKQTKSVFEVQQVPYSVLLFKGIVCLKKARSNVTEILHVSTGIWAVSYKWFAETFVFTGLTEFRGTFPYRNGIKGELPEVQLQHCAVFFFSF